MTEQRSHPCLPCEGRILVVGDARPDLVRTAQALEAVAPTTLARDDEARAMLARFDVDVVVVDAETGRPGIGEIATMRPTATRILLVTGPPPAEACGDAELTILSAPADPQAVQALARLGVRCAAAARATRDLAHRERRLRGLGRPGPAGAEAADELGCYEGILTRSAAMARVLAALRAVEASDTTVLVRGEPGTGKELVAQAIHARSRRRGARFVGVDLGTVPAVDLEAVLFGCAGPGTGAGLVAEAQGGCLFLDQIDVASPALQLALLRLVEDGLVLPPGSDRPRRVDVRVIAASSRDLDQLARDGRFHADLRHQLRLCTIDLPPLRARPEDVFPLAKHFLARTSLAMGRTPPDISREARAVLEAAPWEGNVRELYNAMERAAIRCRSGLVIAADLPVGPAAAATCGASGGSAIAIPPGGATLRQLERDIFQATLALAGGNQSHAAHILGLCESTFRFRLQKLGIASRRASPSPVSQLRRVPLTAHA